MSTKEIKSKLKETRELIKNKDFSAAVKKCQEALKLDENNYTALVLLGACYQDSDKDQATKYLKKAIQVSKDDHLLALQGLASCAPVNELPDVLFKLLKLTPDKCEQIHTKLLQACSKLEDITEVIEALHDETMLKGDQDKIRVEYAWTSLTQILMDHSSVAEEKFLDIFENALTFTCKNQEIPKHLERNHRLISIFHKKQKFSELLRIAVDTNETYPRDTFTLEWLCKLYTDMPELVEKEMEKSINVYSSQLLSINAMAVIALMAQAIHFYRNGEVLKARDVALKVYEIEPKWPTCLMLLYDVYVRLAAFASAEFIYNQNEKMIPKDERIVRCLVQQNDVEKAEKALGICKELLASGETDDTKQIQLLVWLTKALLVCNDVTRAEKSIEKLSSLNCHPDIINVLKSWHLFKSTGDSTTAAASLSDTLDISDPFLLIDTGTIFLHAQKIDAAILQLLRAAKIDNCNSEIFYLLGKAYNSLNDEERCVKCLEKCLQLNFQKPEAVQILSAIYRKRQNWNSNTLLLENAVKFSHGSSGKWAYFQLGLHYLAQKRYDDAVNAFRSALRFKNPERMFYVGLGDAYFARGSYKSALNVYEKAIDAGVKNANQDYIRLQVASINRTLQKFDEALNGFSDLLHENPKYIPALKGIAETHYQLSVHLMQQQRHTRARMNCQDAVTYLTALINLKHDFAFVWRLFGSVLTLVNDLSVENRFLTISGAFMEASEAFVTLRGEELLQLSARCLSRAIKINSDDSVLWRELSKNYLTRATGDNDGRHTWFPYAEQASKQAIKLDGKNWENWNLFGVISVLNPQKNLGLAQHCFIQALNIEKRSGVAWSNLGLLYLSQGNIKLANRAFGKCQQLNEKLANAWLGQALIAEEIGETEEATDLFRHCTELGYNKQSAFGYTNRVCSILDESPRLDDVLEKYRYVINNMNGVALAIDQINWFNKYLPESTNNRLESLSFLAHLCIAKKLYRNAIKAYETALTVPMIDQSQKNKIMCDLGYVYIKVADFKKAVECFESVTEADLKSTIGLALAHAKTDDNETAYSIYGSALQWIASNDLQKSSILTAMSAILYMFQGENDAKTLLFQALCENNLQTLFSACALGLLHHDTQLTDLTVTQMKEHEDDPSIGHHVVFLITQDILYKKKMKQAINYVSSMIHKFPERPELRRILSNVLILYKKSKYEVAAARLALSTISLDISSTRITCDSDVAAKSLALASKSMLRVDEKMAKILAQKAIHMNPTCKEAWAAFVAVAV